MSSELAAVKEALSEAQAAAADADAAAQAQAADLGAQIGNLQKVCPQYCISQTCDRA